MKEIFFNPFFEYNKAPLGAVLEGKEITIRISITQTFNIWNLVLLVHPDDSKEEYIYPLNFEETKDYNIYSVKFALFRPGLFWYNFCFEDCYGKHYICMDENMDSILTDSITKSFQLSVYKDFISELSWFKGNVMYQIMPDRFFKQGEVIVHDDGYLHENWYEHPSYLPVNGKIRNNDYFGGNIKGITSKLDYLDELNVKAIYLNPISLAFSNHRYDTADYLTIDPMLGTDKDFTDLCDKAKEKEMGVIVDGVFNHTGSDSIYFNKLGKFKEVGAFQSIDSPYHKWFKFIKFPNKYHCWWDFDTLPSVNQHSGYIDFITNKVVKKYMNLGASGYRLDVVDELSNSFVEKISKSMKEEKKESILIGEVWEDASNKIAYGHRRSYFNGHQLDSVMNYPLRKAIIDFVLEKDAIGLRNQIRKLINNYPKHVLDSLMNILGTHDTPRILSVCGNVQFSSMSKDEQARFSLVDERLKMAIQRLKLAIVLQYTLPGVPCIYYGDEYGLQGYKDPFCRKTMPWDRGNEEIHDFYIKLGNIRKENKEFVDGEYLELFTRYGVIAYRRNDIYILVNNNEESIYYDLVAEDLITNEKGSHFEIKGMSARILKRC